MWAVGGWDRFLTPNSVKDILEIKKVCDEKNVCDCPFSVYEKVS